MMFSLVMVKELEFISQRPLRHREYCLASYWTHRAIGFVCGSSEPHRSVAC